MADGFYSKFKWLSGVVQLGFQSIGRLGSDANLKFLSNGPQKRRGNRRRYFPPILTLTRCSSIEATPLGFKLNLFAAMGGNSSV
jgi:hypothetical protein